jgi:pimeloyl-ACP methyl ester carboxylesterase
LLNSTIYGEKTEKLQLVILHGLLGSAKNWGSMAKSLSEERQVICLDLRNHGKSPWLPTHSYTDLAQDLTNTLDQKVDLMGHSMGGKAAMALSLKNPKLVNKLIIADISPVNYKHTQVSIIDALLTINLSKISNRTQVIAQMDLIPPDLRTFLVQSINLQKKEWDFNLEVLKEESNKISSFPEFDSKFYGESLFIKGEHSQYTSKSHEKIIMKLFPNCKFEILQECGHWLHYEQPLAYKNKILKFLNS